MIPPGQIVYIVISIIALLTIPLYYILGTKSTGGPISAFGFNGADKSGLDELRGAIGLGTFLYALPNFIWFRHFYFLPTVQAWPVFVGSGAAMVIFWSLAPTSRYITKITAPGKSASEASSFTLRAIRLAYSYSAWIISIALIETLLFILHY